MINVLQRLAELDGDNPNVSQAKPTIGPDAAVEAIQKSLSEELSVESLRYLSGVKETLEECGMMPGMEGAMPVGAPSTPASFSINATAQSGDEVANMLTQIMQLAGAHKVGPEHMPAVAQGKDPNGLMPDANADMKKMLDIMNEPRGPGDNAPPQVDKPEDEGLLGTMAGAGLGALAGGPLGAAVGGAAGDAMTGDEEESVDNLDGVSDPLAGMPDSATVGADMDPGTGEEPPVDIAGVGGGLAAAALSDGDPEEIAAGVEAGKEAAEAEENLIPDAKEDMRRLMDMLDNKPGDPNDVPAFDPNKMAYQPNDAKVGDRMDGTMPKGFAEDAVTQKLFSDYQQFVTEGGKKAKQDYNNNGKVEDPEAEYKGARNNAIKKAMGMKVKK